jgi:beta-glucosidase
MESGAGFVRRRRAGDVEEEIVTHANSALEFDTIVSQASQGSFVTLSMHCTYPCRVDVPGKALFDGLAGLGRQRVKIPLACFDAPGTLEWDHVNTPFLVYTEAPFEAAFANVRLVPNAGDDADAIPCSALT